MAMKQKQIRRFVAEDEAALAAMTLEEGELVFVQATNKWYTRDVTGLRPVHVAETDLYVTQTAHGFTLPAHGFIPVYLDDVDDTWKLAQADDLNKLHAAYIVEIVDVDKFRIAQDGYINVVAHGLNTGRYYFLSDTPGEIQETQGTYDDVMAMPIDADFIQLIDNRPTSGNQVATVNDVGQVVAFVTNIMPSGWLKLDGALVAGGAATYPLLAARYPTWVVGDNIQLPDYRGYFLRGLGGNSGLLGAYQTDATAVNGLDASGAVLGATVYGESGEVGVGQWGLMNRSGGGSNTTNGQLDVSPGEPNLTAPPQHHTHNLAGDIETRPANVAVNWAVKAAPTNMLVMGDTLSGLTMVGADGTNAGLGGYVPAPGAADNEKFLGGDAAWHTIEQLPPYTVIDAKKSLQVNDAGDGLEWVGADTVMPQLAPVLDNTETIPPVAPNASDSYIVPNGAQGVWVGHEGSIATWDGVSAWVFYVPQANDITTVLTGPNGSKAYMWDVSLTPDAWAETVVAALPSTSGGVIFSSGKTIESNAGGMFIHDGNLYAWGKGNSGLNGATQENSIHSLVPSKYKMDGTLVSYEPVFVDLWYGQTNAFFLDEKGFVWAMGVNLRGQLGYSGYATTVDLTMPTQIPFFVNGNIKIKKIVIPVSINDGLFPVAAIAEDGTVYLWAENANGQLGLGNNTVSITTPTLSSVTDVKDVKFSSDNGRSGYILKNDGTLWVSGLNGSGQLGLGNTTARNTYLQSLADVSNFDVYTIAVSAVKTDGTLWGCGSNGYGQLGRGDMVQQTAWVQAKRDAANFVTDAASIHTNAGSGAETAFVITTGRKIRVAGRNALYGLGINNETQQNYYVEPTIVQAPFQGLVSDVVLTGNLNPDNYVLTTTGEVWSAGRNSNGQRGIGNQTAPSASNGLGIWTKMAYPNQIIGIRGMGYDDNSWIATSIYALDIDGNIYTHGYFDQVATDGIGNSEVFSPMLAPVPYQRVSDSAAASPFTGATVSANGAMGLVPAPLVADEAKFLKGDGSWGTAARPGVYTGNASPNFTAPTATPGSGDFYLWTDDGAASGVLQSTWVYKDTLWIQVGGFATQLATTNAVRTYYPLTTALQEKWGAGVMTAGAIAGWGFTAVGGATVLADIGGGLWNGYALIDLNATEPVQGATFTAPTSYVRHEIAITPGADNAYFLQFINETVRDPVLEVWICDPTTGAPLTNGRLYAQCTDAHDINANSQTYFRAPQNTYGISDAYRQWYTWLMPQSLVDAYKTGSNTIKLAIRPGFQNGNTNRIYISGFAMAKADYQFSYTPYLSVHWKINETVAVAGNGGNEPTGWVISSGIYTGSVANNTNRTFRIPIPDVTKDIYLTTMGLYRPTIDVDGPEYCLKHCDFTIKHAGGDVVLGRPRLDIYAPGAAIVEQGYRPLGWIIPAATLAAKVATPAGSAIPYLSINIGVPQWAINNGHFAGFITEAVA